MVYYINDKLRNKYYRVDNINNKLYGSKKLLEDLYKLCRPIIVIDKIKKKIDNYFFDEKHLLTSKPDIPTFFKPFRNIASGEWIRSTRDIKEYEKKTGTTMISYEEAKREKAKAKRYQEIANKADFHKRIEKVIYDVSQGRKFTKEYGYKRAIQ